MLEIRYNKKTKEVTGWCGDPSQWHHLDRGRDETIVYPNIAIPEKSCLAYLYNETSQALVANPGYIVSVKREPLVEIDTLKARVKTLETHLK